MIDLLAIARRALSLLDLTDLSTPGDAAIYLAEADRIMGRDWASPHTFRFGASALLDDLLSILDGTRPRPGV